MKAIPTILLLFVLTCVGCGGAGSGDGDPVAETNNITSTADMKSALESIAQTGEMGSAAMGFRETLDGLKQSDAAKAEKLLTDLEKLEAASTPAATKKIAKQMADQL
ncbi:hypothetical protein [uncultured Gimesia sp.]|uniref:hypothetical protein n=1 Tax=uncultured Gimesia sp. TaxID=1678688 RepID=UPI0030DC4EDF|tara:strand:- start:43518 stop:43838 length:321 start_codon:yes stop_codon:yes gene_type:complete